jgi:hypothetical protein
MFIRQALKNVPSIRNYNDDTIFLLVNKNHLSHYTSINFCSTANKFHSI